MMGTWAGHAGDPYTEVRETHSGVVVLVGDRAYKMKKPVDLGFLDFSTRTERERACCREVELNRRLSPDVYLGVGGLEQPDGSREPLVVMRRMPADRRLSTLARRGQADDADLRELARLVAGLHSRSRRSPEVDAEGGPDRLWARWSDGFRQVRPFHGDVLDAPQAEDVERLALRFLAGRRPLLEARVRRGCIVDGHGDLIAEDVFLLHDGPRVLDCLEFDDRLRYLDRVDDVAFLAMDLERLGAAEQASRLLGWYREFSGDSAPPALVHHYVAYRAFVRAKVACLRHAQGSRPAAAEARTLTGLAHRHLVSGAVVLVLVGGLPATGKSTVAGALADRFGMAVLSSDRVRKEFAGLGPDRRATIGYREGIYSPEQTRATYAELLRRAEGLLGMGESVVLDASWADAGNRSAARGLAERCRADLVERCCRAPAEVAAVRMAERIGPSDADPVIAARMAQDMAPWPQATNLDTAVTLESTLGSALDLFGRRQPPLTRRPVARP